MKPFLIIGSGPASVSCCLALLEKGEAVVMIEKGDFFNDPKFITKDQLYKPFFYDNPKDLKPNFGSFYPFDSKFPLEFKNCSNYPSHTVGGFSEVWGRVVLPFCSDDLDKWPISVKDLEEGYSKISNSIINVHCSSGSSRIFPHFSRPSKLIPESDGISRLISKIKKLNLTEKNMYYEDTRIACNRNDMICTGCGDCIAGCTENILFSTKNTVSKLINNPLFKIIVNSEAISFEERFDGVSLRICNVITKEISILEGKKIVLGAGVLPTFNIVQNSIFSSLKLKVLDVGYFIVPFISFKRLKKENEKYGSLCQWIMGVNSGEIASKRVHMQFYGFNEVYGTLLNYKLNSIYKILKPFFKMVESRLGIIQVFYHSDDSGELEISKSTENVLLRSKSTSKINLKLLYRKLIFLLPLGVVPILFATKKKDPGTSYHIGGSFPMSKHPEKYQTHIDGRLHPFKNIHIVDSSVFPSIPSTTITLSVMANAYRIGKMI